MIRWGRAVSAAVSLLAAFLSGTGMAMAEKSSVQKITFADINGWADDDHVAALSAFVRFCDKEPTSDARFLLPTKAVCEQAHAALQKAASKTAARQFFEQSFAPYRFTRSGFLTGYFEPELLASRDPHHDYPAPLLAKPDGLVAVNDGNRPKNWPEGLSHGRQTANGLVPMPDRSAIMDGALDDEKLELVWLKDPVDAFFVHVQGSSRLRLPDGSVMRVGYAGKTGHPYTSIARVLVKRGEGTPEQLTMSGLRDWLNGNPDKRDDLFRENRSFIFFREIEMERSDDGPIGSANMPLVAGRSLAVDPRFVPFGLPVFVSAPDLKLNEDADRNDAIASLARTLIADDSGSAIKGAARGDLFVGSGPQAGDIAGEIRHPVGMTVLVPIGAEDAFLKRLSEAQ